MQTTEEEILNQLNEKQKESVVYCDGPQLVIAGAGSGKTRVLTYKIAWLLQHYGMNPWNILALTFTNKAAREMKERIAGIVGEERARYLQMGTFHSIFARILRYEASSIGYSSSYTIYDESDSRSVLKSIIKQMGLDDKTYKPSAVHAVISRAKNGLRGAEEYAADEHAMANDARRNMAELYKIFVAYQQRLKASNAMDFDDLLLNTYLLLSQHPDIRKKYAERFSYILVDEYQDTNYAQQQIIQLLTGNNPHVCMVGDDYQSIYAFRGANISNMLHFNAVYPNVKLFKLEQNYRSTQNIVSAANSLMKHNRQQIDKDVFSRNAEGEKVIVWETTSDKREAAIVCREIKRLRKQEGLHYSDFAILYRTNAQSRLFEEEMMKPEVGLAQHYQVYGGVSFYQRKEIKDIIAYYRLVVNPDDEEALLRVINYPARGIGDKTVQRVGDVARASGVSMWQVISHPDDYPVDVNSGARTKLAKFQQLVSSFISQLPSTDALTLGKLIITNSGIEEELRMDNSPEGDMRRDNVDGLVSGIADFVNGQQESGNSDHATLADYLPTVALLTDQDSDSDTDDKIKLMTIHASKGLEFNTVFVVGMEENIFPSLMSLDNPKNLEEERRLLYVAITRAEKHCYLTWAHSRWRFGKADQYVEKSRFLADIDPQFVDHRSEGGVPGGMTWKTSGIDRPWSDNFEINRPYTGFRDWGEGYHRSSNRMQNSRPVAGQFMADPKPKITSPHRPEQAVNPFSEGFEQRLKREGRWTKVSRSMANGGRVASEHAAVQSTVLADGQRLSVGSVIEHPRFGRGKVVVLEGSGDNRKATVEFDETGRKQLLLKFSRFKIVG